MIDEKKLIEELTGTPIEMYLSDNGEVGETYDKCTVVDIINNQPKVGEWIPVSERLPEERDWYLAVFKESDTGFILIPRVADYVGSETTITTKDYWIIIGEDTPMEYIRKLECIAWQPLPKPYKESEEE